MALSSMQSVSVSRSERLSALTDGEPAEDLSQILKGLTAADTVVWSEYHLIGDVLRSAALAQGADTGQAFMQRFSACLAAEPHVLAPNARRRALRGIATIRRRALPAVAVAAAAATLTWVLIPQLQNSPGGTSAQLASTSAPVQRVAMVSLPDNGATHSFAVIRDASLDQCLQAHQQFAPDPVVQGAMPYIRASATSDGQ